MSMIGVIFLTWKRYLQKRTAEHDITLKQYYLLRKLDRCGYMYPSEIAEDLFCDRPTASVIIRNMEKKGWVVREQDSENRRAVQVLITEAGRTKFEASKSLLKTDFDPLGCFTQDELTVFEGLLGKLREHLSDLD